MSTQKGNSKKKKPQKYQNRMAFQNNMHDTSGKMKSINGMTVGGVCERCKETIQWKIKYKKYKPLTQAKKCTKCSKKTVKYAYHIICSDCAKGAFICAKCGVKAEVINPYGKSPEEQAAEDSKLEAELKALSERKRRAFFRYQEAGCPDVESEKEAQNYECKEGEEDESCEEEDEDEESKESVDDQIYEPPAPQCTGTDSENQLLGIVNDALNLHVGDDDNVDHEGNRDVTSSSKHTLSVHFEGDALPNDDSAQVEQQET